MLSKSYLKAVRKCKEKGFSHFKVELEAQLDRGDAESYCDDCSGEGTYSCTNCEGSSYVMLMDNAGNEYENECRECDGEGDVECNNCSGRGRERGDDWTVEQCESFILDNIKQETRQALNFSYFYEDGSVDSEFTFTMPVEKAHLSLDVINVWNRLAQEIGGGMDISKAGMHLSLLPSSSYPCDRGLLNPSKMQNFRDQVTKLLPALYFSASHNNVTRSLEYRMPRVSEDDKYSAIYTHGDTCLEFRIFDTCYDKPEAIFDKLEVMANTLDYYSSKKLDVKYKQFEFEHEYPNHMPQLFKKLANVRALEETITYVKPSKSFKRMSEERGVQINKRQLAAEIKQEQEAIRRDYDKYLSQFSERLGRQVNNIIEEARAYTTRGQLDYVVQIFRDKPEALLDHQEAVKLVLANARGFGLRDKPVDFSSFSSERTERSCYYRLQVA